MLAERYLERIHLQFDSKTDFPCLFRQYQKFRESRPLRNLRVLHSTPLFENSLPKILPLLASEAEVTVTLPASLPFDSETAKFVANSGVRFVERVNSSESFDIIIDCLGSASSISSRFGATELTRSGAAYYKNSSRPCLIVDDSRVKLVEDLLGTSDGLLRALKQLGIDIREKRVLLFGFGKVGKGIYVRLKRCGAIPSVVEIDPKVTRPWGFEAIAFDDQSHVLEEIKSADIIVTATGKPFALQSLPREPFFQTSKTLLNMGAEDEYGSSFSEAEIINKKHPANFILSQPTQLRYLDATFALQNTCCVDLVNYSDRLRPGLQAPLSESEHKLLIEIKESNLIWQEICSLNLQSLF